LILTSPLKSFGSALIASSNLRRTMKLYAVSFFELDRDGLIKSVTEYWGDTYEPPEWRKDLVERY
jgi:hypothetical protein